MQLEQNSFKRAIAEGQPQIGFWVTLNTVGMPRRLMNVMATTAAT